MPRRYRRWGVSHAEKTARDGRTRRIANGDLGWSNPRSNYYVVRFSAHAVTALWLDAVLSVKVVHRVEPRTQAARRDNDVNVVRKFLFDPRRS